jgi:hypothetical protein
LTLRSDRSICAAAANVPGPGYFAARISLHNARWRFSSFRSSSSERARTEEPQRMHLDSSKNTRFSTTGLRAKSYCSYTINGHSLDLAVNEREPTAWLNVVCLPSNLSTPIAISTGAAELPFLQQSFQGLTPKCPQAVGWSSGLSKGGLVSTVSAFTTLPAWVVKENLHAALELSE